MTLAAPTTDQAINNLFVWASAVLVFFMHVGFSMLEGAAVQEKNRTASLIKNGAIVGFSALAWWSVGYLVSGTGAGDAVTHENTFIGTITKFDYTPGFLADIAKTDANYIGWFWGWVFALTATTIVSGSVAERFTLKAYLFFAFCIAGFIYPVVVAWCWRDNGWLKKAGDKKDITDGFIDFAGSGVVHMVGGTCGLAAAWLVGPRKYLDDGKGGFRPRFGDDGSVNAAANTSSGVFATLGSLILWFGWFAFNAGKASTVTAAGGIAGLATVNTVLAPAGAGSLYVILTLSLGSTDLTGVLNSILGGLVAISAGCNVVEPWAAFFIGMMAAPVYIFSSKLLKRFRIDDPLDASPVHLFCGIWGLLATGLFASKDLSGTHKYGWWLGDSGVLFSWQLTGACSIFLWSLVVSLVVLMPMYFMGMLRVSDDEEKLGLDACWAKHNAMSLSGCPPTKDPLPSNGGAGAAPTKNMDQPALGYDNGGAGDTRFCA